MAFRIKVEWGIYLVEDILQVMPKGEELDEWLHLYVMDQRKAINAGELIPHYHRDLDLAWYLVRRLATVPDRRWQFNLQYRSGPAELRSWGEEERCSVSLINRMDVSGFGESFNSITAETPAMAICKATFLATYTLMRDRPKVYNKWKAQIHADES